MIVYTEYEFVNLVNHQNDINFLAAAITPWHALGIDAAIYRLQQQGIKLKGYIMLMAHSTTGSAINASNFHMPDYEDIIMVTIDGSHRNRTFSDKIKNKCSKYWYYIKHDPYDVTKPLFYWATPLKPSYELIPKIAFYKPDYNIQFIITDEGLGSYLNTPYTWWKFSFLEGGVRAGLKATWSILIRDNYYIHRLKKRKQIQYYQLLKGKKGHWVQNQEAIADYRHILAIDKQKYDFTYYEKAIIINTDMLFESGVIKQGRDALIYQKIAHAMSDKEIPIILKPHPREKDIARYANINCMIEKNSSVAQENIFATLSNNPYCVIGIASTTLVTAKILFGIEAISINHLIPSKDLNDKNVFTNFNKTFSDLLYMPKSEQELLEDIDHCINR
ncbi:MAG: polysialyltransferase family glycosyltransferase [Lachnospiraceae bacterium]